MDLNCLEGTDRRRVERWEKEVDGNVGNVGAGVTHFDLGGGPPRSKPSAPVRNRAVTFNEPENEDSEGKFQLIVESLGSPWMRADFYTDREPGPDHVDSKIRKNADTARARALRVINPGQLPEQSGTPFQKRKVRPADSDSDSNLQRFVESLMALTVFSSFSMTPAHHLRPRAPPRPPKKKQDHGKSEALSGLRPGWANARKKTAVNEGREPSDDEDQPNKSTGNGRDRTLTSVSPLRERSR